jgi:hypothetical protein
VVVILARDAGWRFECSYDHCLSDADCGGHACGCRGGAFSYGAPYSRSATLGENTCFSGNCRVDGDCGPNGYCSPSTYVCGTAWGYHDFYCHTASDECIDDSDCDSFDGGPFAPTGPAYCAYDEVRAHWSCNRGVMKCHDS